MSSTVGLRTQLSPGQQQHAAAKPTVRLPHLMDEDSSNSSWAAGQDVSAMTNMAHTEVVTVMAATEAVTAMAATEGATGPAATEVVTAAVTSE